jgi:hypothetical protein
VKTVAKVLWIHEADLIKAELDSHGIPAFIPDEGMAVTYPVMGNTLGGIRVQVNDEDEARAREIIGRSSDASVSPESCITCPSCGSERVSQSKMSVRMFFGSLLLLGFPFILMKRRFRCEACGWRWKAGENKE